MPDERHVADILNAHYPGQFFVLFISPKYDAIVDFMFEFISGHVGVFQTILGDNTYVCVRSLIDNGINSLKIAIVTKSNHSLEFLSQNSGS